MRFSSLLLPLALAATVACSGCKSKKKLPIDAPPPPPIDADISTGAGPGPRQLEKLGEPFTAEADGSAGEPGLAVDRDGKALLAFVEKGKVHVRRWSGTAWDALGAPPNDATHRASGKPSITSEASGAIVVGWQEMNKADVNVLQLARWKDSAWTALPALGSGKAGQGVMDPIVEASPVGLVAVWRETEAAGKDAVHVAMYDDASSSWKPMGEGGLLRAVAEGTTRRAPALSTSKAGVLAGWIEVAPSSTLQLRRWDAAAARWTEVPAPEGADDNSTLAVALSPDGTITVAMSYAMGMRQLVQLLPGATDWIKIDVPEIANGYAPGQRLAVAEDGRVIFTYPFAGRFGWWDGKAWTATPVGVLAPTELTPVAATGPGGVVYVAWSQGPANGPSRVRVLEVKKQALGEK
jgi:hypothetical protein